MIYAMGAFGTNNLGDDAIFLGVQKTHSHERVIQVFVNWPSVEDSIGYDKLRVETFTPQDTLLIGGGGLLHCKHALEDYVISAKLAKEAGAKVIIRRIGAEGVREGYYAETKELFSLVDSATVRSKKSLEYLYNSGVDISKICVEPDFAYSIRPRAQKAKSIRKQFQHTDWPIIGLVTAGNRSGVEAISYVVSELILADVGCNIVHIPHSRSYVNQYNDDIITGEQIWTSIGVYYADKQHRYIPEPMAHNPYELFDRYAQVDGIIGYRYHSFIFSKITQKPILGIVAGDKAEAFFNEENYGQYVSTDVTKEELLERCKEFVKKIKGS